MTGSSSAPSASLTADLVYDTKTEALAVGVRTAIRRNRRVLYAAAETELVLQIAPECQPEHVRLLGQILDEGSPVEGAAVTVRGSASDLDCSTDEDGQFRVADLRVGRYDVDIAYRAGLVHVGDIDVA